MKRAKTRLVSLVLTSSILLTGCGNILETIKNSTKTKYSENIISIEKNIPTTSPKIEESNEIVSTTIEAIEETDNQDVKKEPEQQETEEEISKNEPLSNIEETEEIKDNTQDNQQAVEKQTFENQIVYSKENTNLYSNNNDNAMIIGNIKINDSAYRILSESNGWDLIKYNNQIAYIKTGNLEYTDNKVETEYNYIPKTDIVLTTTILNFREGPSTNYNVINVLNTDTELEVIAEVNNGWLLVKYNGVLGYVSGSYTTSLLEKINDLYPEVSLTELTPKSIVYTISPLNFRIGPGSEYESIGQFEKYESLRVLKEFDDWYFIMTNEHTFGYVYKEYVKELEDIFIVVDKSEQKMFMYKNNELYYVTSVTTGKDSSPSDTGLFRIWIKQKDRYLTDGKTYNSHVDYVMFYNGGEGIHDANWRFMFYVEGVPERKKFGTELYHQYGSHGCINTPSDIMDDIYSLSEVGTKVLVHK